MKPIIFTTRDELVRVELDKLKPITLSVSKEVLKTLKLCFITGVARFRHYTLFSGLRAPTTYQ